jgi:hypothetical protein
LFDSVRLMTFLPRAQASNPTGLPDVVLVGFDFDGNYFYVGGMNLLKTTKYRNILKNNKVAFVIDEEVESGKAQSCLA